MDNSLQGQQTVCPAHVQHSHAFGWTNGRHLQVCVNAQLWAAVSLLLNASNVYNQHVTSMLPSSVIAQFILAPCLLPSCMIPHYIHARPHMYWNLNSHPYLPYTVHFAIHIHSLIIDKCHTHHHLILKVEGPSEAQAAQSDSDDATTFSQSPPYRPSLLGQKCLLRLHSLNFVPALGRIFRQ